MQVTEPVLKQVCEKMQERKRDVFNVAERRGGTLTVDDDDDNKPKFDWKQTRLGSGQGY